MAMPMIAADRARKASGYILEPIRILERPSADYHPCRSFSQQLFHLLCGSAAAANLNLAAHGAKNRQHHFEIRSNPHCGIEVHDMEVAKAFVLPVPCNADRVVDPYHLVCVGTTDELHAATVAQVNRGNDDHVVTDARNAWMNATPAAELFSG